MGKVLLLSIVLVSISFVSSSAQTYKTTKDNYIAAITEDYLDTAMDLITAKDTKALQKLMDTGAVFWLRAGVKVQVIDRTWTGKIEIRPKGEIGSVWTVMEAVE